MNYGLEASRRELRKCHVYNDRRGVLHLLFLGRIVHSKGHLAHPAQHLDWRPCLLLALQVPPPQKAAKQIECLQLPSCFPERLICHVATHCQQSVL